MGKRLTALLLAGILSASICACDAPSIPALPKKETHAPVVEVTPEPVPEVTPEPTPVVTPAPQYTIAEEYKDISFETFLDRQFMFSSGVGGWNTTVNVTADGIFAGQYHDSEMGTTGEGFPNGTLFMSNFYGHFTQPENVNDYTWVITVRDLHYYQEPGTEEIIDGVLYSYSSCYGLMEGDKVYIYVPGAPLRELPDEFLRWIGYNDKLTMTDKYLDSICLYNVTQEYGFTSYEFVDESTRIINNAEAETFEINRILKEQETNHADQANFSQKLFEVWDNALNGVWGELAKNAPQDALNRVISEEIAWIQYKDSEIQKAGQQQTDEILARTAANNKAAEITRERVYELYAIIQNG